MFASVLPLLLGYILIASYGSRLSATICRKNILTSVTLHSFASGVLVTALFLFFFHEIYALNEPVPYLLLMTLSFVVFFSISAHQRYHHIKKSEFQQFVTLSLEGVHYFVIGVLFAHFAEFSAFEALLAAVPILLLKFVFAYEKYNHHQKESKTEKYLMEVMTILGFVVALVFHLPEIVFGVFIAIVAGSIFYSITTIIFTRIDVDPKTMIGGFMFYGLLLTLPLLI